MNHRKFNAWVRTLPACGLRSWSDVGSPHAGSVRTQARGENGFTFLELMIVMVIISVLASVAVPVYMAHLRKAKEVALQQDLWEMRHAIDDYTVDKEKPPTGLEDLVTARYLHAIPKDPICPDCQWTVIPAETDDLNAAGGIGNVKSSAEGSDSNGKAYTDY